MENTEQVQTQQEQTPIEAQPQVEQQTSTDNWEAKYKEAEARIKEYDTFQSNVQGFFNADPRSYERLTRWYGKQPLDDEMPNVKATPKPSKESLDEVLPKLKAEWEREFKSKLDPLVEMSSELKANYERQRMKESHPWLTDEKFKEFENRFNKAVDEEIKSIYQKYPAYRMRPDEAREMVLSKYVNYDQDALLFTFMKDEFLASAAKGARTPQSLPPGMLNKVGNKAGPMPGQFEQLKKAIADANGPEESALLMKEFAEKNGYKIGELQKLIHEGE